MKMTQIRFFVIQPHIANVTAIDEPNTIAPVPLFSSNLGYAVYSGKGTDETAILRRYVLR